jgi:hypothetical protein
VKHLNHPDKKETSGHDFVKVISMDYKQMSIYLQMFAELNFPGVAQYKSVIVIAIGPKNSSAMRLAAN